MKDYIVKNCDCIKEYQVCLTSDPPQFRTEYKCSKDFKSCKDKNDCLLKQIVELCRGQKTIECNIDGKEQVLKAYCHTHLGNKILEHLEIEEVK